MSHSDRPEYDKLIRILEKGKAKVPSYVGANPKISPLVDNEVNIQTLNRFFNNLISYYKVIHSS